MTDKALTAGRAGLDDLLFKEQSTWRSSYYHDSQLAPYNPDDVVQKDFSYKIYQDMLKDDQVSVCTKIKKDLILGSNYEFVEQDNNQSEISQDLKIAIDEDPEWSFEEMLEEMITSYDFGFSVSEKTFKKRLDGRMSLRFIKTRFPGSWLLHTDEHGNVCRYEQMGNLSNVDVPKSCLIHVINGRRFSNPYGNSDLRPAHDAWFTKKHITRWYAVHIEKCASPIPVATYDEQADEEARQQIFDTIKKFQTRTALMIPNYIKVSFLDSQSSGEAFTKGIDIFNLFIGRSLLIPDLLGFQGGETSGGAYALGKAQLDLFFKHINRRKRLLEAVVNKEIVWPIVVYNFGKVKNYPKFRFKDISSEVVFESTKLWLDAVKSNVYRPSDEEIDYFKDVVNYPKVDANNNNPPIGVDIGAEIRQTKDGGEV